MDLDFRRHSTTKKINGRKAAQNILGCPRPLVFSVDQGYSLMGCFPAEPISAYPDNTNVKNYLYL